VNKNNGDLETFKPDEVLMYNLKLANELELDIQKLLITLSTGAVVLSVALLRIFPLSRIVEFSLNLIWSWFCFGFSIISGIISLITKSWWVRNKLLIDRSKKEKYQRESFKKLTSVYKILGIIFARIQELTFFIAIVLMIIFAVKVIKIQDQ